MKEDKQLLVKIFQVWVSDRLASYQEPTREGTPKGSPIGFSKTKFYAANLMILHEFDVLSLAEIAKKAQTSHALIRKWRTEKQFNNLAYYSYKEFWKYVQDHALVCIDNWTSDCEQYFTVLDMFPASSEFKMNLFRKFIDKSRNKPGHISIADWLEFFVAYKFSFDNVNKEKLSHIDIDIIDTFVMWLLSFMVGLNIDLIQKQLIGLLIKQLYPKLYNQWLSTQSPSE